MCLFGDEMVFVWGVEGVDLFYDESCIVCYGVMFGIVQEMFFGYGLVYSFDGDVYWYCKVMFVEVVYEDVQVEWFMFWFECEWVIECDDWFDGGMCSVYEVVVGVFGCVIMGWVGLFGILVVKIWWLVWLVQIVDGFGVFYLLEYVVVVVN